MSRFVFMAGLVLFAALPLLGGQAPTPTPMTKADDSAPRKDDLTSEELIHAIIERGKKGIKTTEAQAALCPICNQPLYMHMQEGFVCKPPDSTIQKVEYARVSCPVCTTVFQAAKPGNVNAKGGRDRDFCPHSVGRYAVHASVWMCPDCGYSAQVETFLQRPPQAASRELVEFVKTKLTAPTREFLSRLAGLKEDAAKPAAGQDRFSEYVDQTTIPDWLKYANALATIEAGLTRLPHGVQARLYCEAAHSCRRFLSFELGSALENQTILIGLGQTARRVNDWLMAECFRVREERLGERPDPNQQFTLRLMNAAHEPETDPAILLQGARLLNRKIEEIIRLESQQNPDPAKPSKVTRLDQYVFHLRYAGILDRVGDLNGAIEQLEKAQGCVPKEVPSSPQPLAPEAKANVEKVLAALKAIPAERIDLIHRERQYLFRAAHHLMQALYFEEQARNLDPAMNCYLIGEMLRRSEGEPAAASAWFDAARQLFQKIEPEKAQPRIPPGTGAEEAAAIRQRAVATLEEKKRVMLGWIDEQQRAIKNNAAGKEPEPRIKEAIAKVLSGGGAASAMTPAAAAAVDPRIPAMTPDAPPALPVETARPDAATPGKAGLSREALLKRYHEALLAYQQQNGGPPKLLKDLVAAGALKQGESCLDEQGRLICPETGGALIYVPPTALGAHIAVIVPTSKDTNRVRLFADGHVGEK